MFELPLSKHEEGRIAALKLYDVLDTAAEPEFDSLAQLAAEICKTPIAIISIVDDKRTWFKSHIGLKVQDMPRESSFCRYTILKDDIFEVTDPLSDNRFDKNILVSHDPGIRYYAGIALVNKDGYRLGTLAVMGQYPNKLNEHQKVSLKILRASVMSALELRREEKEGNFYKEALYQIAPVAVTDAKLNYEYVNEEFCALADMRAGEILGKNQGVINLADLSDEQNAAIFESLTDNKTWKGRVRNQNKRGAISWSNLTLIPFTNKNKEILKTVSIRNDVTNEVLLKEKLDDVEVLSKTGSWELNIINRDTTWSTGMYSIFEFDYHHEKSKDQSILSFVIPGDFERVNDVFKKFMGTEPAGDKAEFRIITKKGKDPGTIKKETNDGKPGSKVFSETVYFKIVTRKGHEKEIIAIIRNRTNSKGDLIGLHGTLRDVTDMEISAPNATRGAAKQTKSGSYDMEPFGFHTTDDDGKFTEMNHTELAWLGYSRDEVIDKLTINDILPVDSLHAWQEAKELLARNGILKDYNLSYKRKDGSHLPVLLNATATTNNKGILLGTTVFAYDITTVRKAHDALEESEAMYRNLIEESAQMLFTADVQGRFTYVSSRLKKTIGYSDKDLLGKQFASIYDGEWRKKSIAFYQKQLLDRTEETTYLFPIIIKTGEKLWIEQVATLIKKNGNIVGYRFALYDITERLKTQEAMQEAARLATEAKEMQQTFLGKMSHEIRTPMNGVVGMVNLLNTTQLTEEQKEFVDGIKESSKNMIRIINDILDVTKIESGKLIFEETEFVLKNLVNSVIFTLKAVADEKNIQLISQIDSQIPDMVVADPVRLNQILLNLADNALKFTEKGSVTITVQQKDLRDDILTLEFTISDTGIGIPQNKINTIFESFTQAQSDTTRKYGGTGLGLTIAKQLIEQQKGEIKVTSKEGKGTTFTFTFNFKLNQSNAFPEKTQLVNMKISSLAGCNVLLVEDNIMNQRVAKYTIEKWGAKVTIAESGHKGLELVAKNNYDIILMDIQMPEMNGIQTTSKIRKELKSKTPIMAMTASVMQGERENCMKAGMNDYISKPFNPAELNQKMFDLIPKKDSGGGEKKITNITYLKNAVGDEISAVKEILEIYLSKTPVLLDALEKDLSLGHFEKIQSQVHNLKNSVGIIGADNLFHLLDNIEFSLNTMPPTAEALASIEKMRVLVRQSLKEIIEEYKAL